MTLQELFNFLSSSSILPQTWEVGEDNDGQLLIYTGLKCDENNNLLFYGEDE